MNNDIPDFLKNLDDPDKFMQALIDHKNDIMAFVNDQTNLDAAKMEDVRIGVIMKSVVIDPPVKKVKKFKKSS